MQMNSFQFLLRLLKQYVRDYLDYLLNSCKKFHLWVKTHTEKFIPSNVAHPATPVSSRYPR